MRTLTSLLFIFYLHNDPIARKLSTKRKTAQRDYLLGAVELADKGITIPDARECKGLVMLGCLSRPQRDYPTSIVELTAFGREVAALLTK